MQKMIQVEALSNMPAPWRIFRLRQQGTIALLLVLLSAGALASSPFRGLGSERAAHGPQGYLGINFRDVTDEQVALLKLKDARGEEVFLLDHDGPACKAGLREHDVIVQMDGQSIDSEEQLRRMLREAPAGRRVTFVISRDGQQQTVSMQLANRDTFGQEAWEKHMTVPEPSGSGPRTSGFFGGNAPIVADLPKRGLMGSTTLNASYTGALLEPMGPQLADFFGAQGGLLVRAVDPDSPAATAGMRAGDVVVKVNALLIVRSADWVKMIHDNRGHALAVVVLRDKKEQILTLTPDTKKRSSLPLPPQPTVGMLAPLSNMQ